ncbi:hypothetical protein [Solirubrobacter soli]|uniref:hypothetical protein n=1 Tax=Solirubrobacter soli TaxID=363832 RepID=UPI0012FCDB0F|nr:hypothetical protein [Solirubrobacter soli]
MTRSLRCIVPLVAAFVLASCGSDSKDTADPAQRASATSDVNALLRTTFANVSKMQSATVDMQLKIVPRKSGDGPVTAHLSGPFATQGQNKLPKFAFTAELTSGGQTFNAGATYDGSKAYVALMGTPYVVSDLVTRQFVAGYEQSLKTRQKAQGGLVLGTLGIDFTKWLPNASNEGETQVGDAKTIKISGQADVKQVIADLEKITEKASALNVPGASGRLPQKLTPEQKAAAENAIKNLTVEVYTGVDDSILRRLVVNADLQDAGSKIDAGLSLDVTFTKVGQEQTITAPSNPKPFTELLKAVDAAGLANLGLGGAAPGGASDSTVPNSSKTPNNVDKYATCIEAAKGDAAKARKCADLLSG